MKALLVTGGNGQLARALAALAPHFATIGYALRKIGRPTFDFDRPETIDSCFADAAPAVVVNAAGWTAVDAAESDPAGAARANDSGPDRLAALCRAIDIPFIHVSTDYVFDGAKGAPYVETDPPNPLGIYGATKLAGEKKILAHVARSTILRTSWVYAAEGRNFVRTMLAAAQRNNTLWVVADQHGCPTNADDLARAIYAIVHRIDAGWQESYRGIFHMAGSGSTTWHGFAEAIFASAASFGHPHPSVIPISTADWPTAAQRPMDSRLNCDKLEHVFGIRLPDWRPSLDRTIAEICQPS